MIMKRSAKLELVIVSIVLVIIIYLSILAYFAETNTNVMLLVIGIILTAILGWYNMFKSLFKSAEAIALEEANRLKEKEHEFRIHDFRR